MITQPLSAEKAPPFRDFCDFWARNHTTQPNCRTPNRAQHILDISRKLAKARLISQNLGRRCRPMCVGESRRHTPLTCFPIENRILDFRLRDLWDIDNSKKSEWQRDKWNGSRICHTLVAWKYRKYPAVVAFLRPVILSHALNFTHRIYCLPLIFWQA